MLLSKIVAHTDYTCEAFRDAEITDIVYDSRKAAPGTLFVALAGALADGHDYAESAYQNGARAFLAERPLELPADALVLLTENTRAALAVISAEFFRHPERERQKPELLQTLRVSSSSASHRLFHPGYWHRSDDIR